jgi:phage terminase large subunit
MSNIQFPDKLKPLWEDNKTRVMIVSGGRSSGKSWGVIGYAVTKSFEDKLFIQVSREISNSLDVSAKKLVRETIDRMGFTDYFSVTEDKIINKLTGSTIYFRGLKGGSKQESETRLKSSEGIDILIIEEASSVSYDTILAINPTIRGTMGDKKDGQVRRIIYILNPSDPAGDPVIQFYKKEQNVRTITINIEDNPFAPQDQIDISENMKIQDYPLWLHIYGGQPKSYSMRSALNIVDYDLMVNRKNIVTYKTPIQVGADIARFGDDLTTFCKVAGGKSLIDLVEYKKQDLATTTEKLIKYANGAPIVVDDTGLTGVADHIRKRGYPVYGLNFAQKAGIDPHTKNNYANITTELWLNFLYQKDKISLIKHDGLKYELLNRRIDFDAYGRQIIERKSEYKNRCKSSPDYSDCTMMGFFKPQMSYNNIRIYR